LPVSIYSDLIFGNTFALNAAQCEQVIDAYSVIVTEALAGPSAISGSDTGLATSDALCAIASTIRRSGENPARAASPVSDRAVVKTRRVMNQPAPKFGAGPHTQTRSQWGLRFALQLQCASPRKKVSSIG